MEELKKLIRLIEEDGKGSANALLNLSDTKNLETQLYNLVRDTEHLVEDEALQKLYGSQLKSGAFKMLKSRVKRKLYNQLNFLDVTNDKKFPKRIAAEIRCNALLNEALLLNHNEVTHLKDKIVQQALKLAKEAELTSQIIKALEIQRELYSFNTFNRKKFYEVSDKLLKYYDLLILESQANDLYFRLLSEIRVGVKNRQEQIDFINKSVDRLYELWRQTGSSFIFSKYYVGKTIALESFSSAQDLITHLRDSESLFQKGIINPYHFFYKRNQYALTYAYLKNKQYQEGFIVADRLKDQLDSSAQNWFAHMENYFLLATHSGDYGKARQVLDEVLASKYLTDNPPFAQERWFLHKEFYTLVTNQKLNYTSDLELKVITQDKSGYNIWYLILGFLKVLKGGDAELIERNAERLRKYIAKHLGPRSDERTRLFMKLLLIAGQEYPNVQVCKRKGRYLFTKLEQTPTAGDAYAETEIIPYEHLWELLLKNLENNK